MVKRKLLLLLCGLALGCAERASDGDVARDTTSQTPPSPAAPSPAPVSPESAAIARIRAALPPGLLARQGACPFECCVYGTWVADTTIPVYPAPQTRGRAPVQWAKGTRMQADSGIVFVTSLAFAVVEDTVFRYADKRPWLLPDDTLVLLEPVGEGYWSMWRRGEVLKEVPPFFENIPEPKSGYLVGKPGREWWVHARANGQSGWFPADSVRVRGSDACGGPME